MQSNTKNRGVDKMSVRIEIPDDVAQAIRLPEERMQEKLQVELAVALYAQGLLSFGKARELAQVDKYAFGLLLGERGVPRHYGLQELEDDLAYARGE
jgi:predicted HTH domain antitoxin